MGKHRLSNETPEQFTVKAIIRRVIDESPEKNRHSKRYQWQLNMKKATLTDFERLSSPSHHKLTRHRGITYVGPMLNPQVLKKHAAWLL